MSVGPNVPATGDSLELKRCDRFRRGSPAGGHPKRHDPLQQGVMGVITGRPFIEGTWTWRKRSGEQSRIFLDFPDIFI